MSPSLEHARELDAADPLAQWRDNFHLPADTVYLCGHSLGLQPKAVAGRVAEELENWQRLGVKGHFEGKRSWMLYHELLTEKAATLVGAKPVEVVHMNTLTVNLHLLMVSFYRPTAERHKILIEKHAFPSDRYAVESQIRYHGLDPDESLVEVDLDADLETLIEKEKSELALVWLGGVNYYSGQLFDMGRITEQCHEDDVVVGFDLAHAAGNVPLELHDWGVDFAAWCTYKYLNGGPGAVGAAFVHERHGSRVDLPRFAGWWGHQKATRFKMGPEFVPSPGAEGWQLSNPPILSLAPVLSSLEIFDAVGIEKLREKAVQLTGLFEKLVAERLSEKVEVITPSAPERRGCQLSLRVRGGRGRQVFEGLSARGVVCDWREPDVIRAAPVPLYNRFEDVHLLVDALDDETRS